MEIARRSKAHNLLREVSDNLYKEKEFNLSLDVVRAINFDSLASFKANLPDIQASRDTYCYYAALGELDGSSSNSPLYAHHSSPFYNNTRYVHLINLLSQGKYAEARSYAMPHREENSTLFRRGLTPDRVQLLISSIERQNYREAWTSFPLETSYILLSRGNPEELIPFLAIVRRECYNTYVEILIILSVTGHHSLACDILDGRPPRRGLRYALLTNDYDQLLQLALNPLFNSEHKVIIGLILFYRGAIDQARATLALHGA